MEKLKGRKFPPALHDNPKGQPTMATMGLPFAIGVQHGLRELPVS